MANNVYCSGMIECSDAKKLIEILVEKDYIQGDVDELIENGDAEAYFDIDDFYTGYCGEGNITFYDDTIEFTGTGRWNVNYTEGIDAIFSAAEDNDIEITSFESHCEDEYWNFMCAVKYPLPDWYVNYRKTTLEEGERWQTNGRYLRLYVEDVSYQDRDAADELMGMDEVLCVYIRGGELPADFDKYEKAYYFGPITLTEEVMYDDEVDFEKEVHPGVPNPEDDDE